MSDISAIASAAMGMSQSNMQQQIEISLLRNSAQAERQLVDMIMENAKRIQELSKNTSGRIDFYA